LVNEVRSAGYHQAVWDGSDSKGAPAATGVYFYRIVAGDAFIETRKMVLMK
jgi:flagellar hook assembly protein FlgD